MKHLFSDWEKVLARVHRAQICCLLLDFDGTLTPIVATPRLAVCPPEVRSLLEELRDSPRFELAMISGRALDDIRDKVGIDGITYVGNHGLGFLNPVGECRRYLSPQRQSELHLIREELGSAFGDIPGILFEDKGAILAVHFRNVPPELAGPIPKLMHRILAKWNDHWDLSRGKMVLEVCPRAKLDKSKAAERILRFFPQEGLLPVALGDDDTDEDVFRTVGNRGITVFVGNERENSEAEYFLRDPSETLEFLKRLAACARQHAKPGCRLEKTGGGREELKGGFPAPISNFRRGNPKFAEPGKLRMAPLNAPGPFPLHRGRSFSGHVHALKPEWDGEHRQPRLGPPLLFLL